MSFATPVAILGFTPFERSTCEAFLLGAVRRAPAYRLEEDPLDADFVIVDADDRVLVRRVQAAGLLPRSVMLGAAGHPAAALHLPRPFNLMQMLRSLDSLRRVLPAPAAAAGPLVARAAIQTPVPAPAPATAPSSRRLQAGAFDL